MLPASGQARASEFALPRPWTDNVRPSHAEPRICRDPLRQDWPHPRQNRAPVLEVWWVRHASTDWNTEGRWQGHTDVPLNDSGRAEARCLAPRMRPVPFDSAWSSDLERCLETARLALPGREIRGDPRLREMPMGLVEGLTWAEAPPPTRQAIRQWWKDPYGLPFPGSTESLHDVTRRIQDWLSEMPDDGRVVAFTHGGVIRCCVWALTGPPQDRSWSLELGNTGIVRIRYDRTRNTAVLVAHNDLSHLPDAWKRPPGQQVPGEQPQALHLSKNRPERPGQDQEAKP